MNPSPLTQEFVENGRSVSCPVIDMHTHPGLSRMIYFPNALPEKMIETLDRCGVRLIVAVPPAALIDPRRGNAFTEKVIRQFPGRVLGYWGINPNYPEQVKNAVADFTNHPGFVGFKFLGDYHRYPITGENYRLPLEYANENGLLVLMHTSGHSAYNSPAMVRELAEEYPHATLLMGHAGGGGSSHRIRGQDESVRVANEFDNVYLELCGAANWNGVVDQLVAGSGSQKILFGTDLPWFDPHYIIGCVLFARITDEDRHNILYRNAEKLLVPFGVEPSGK